MLSRVSFILRHLAAALALVGYLAHGGQAHLAFSEGETVSIMMCGQGGNRTIELDFGETSPPEDTKSEHCGDCTHPPDAAHAASEDTACSGMLPVRVLLKRQSEPVHPGGPLWPGAPPNGPPTLT